MGRSAAETRMDVIEIDLSGRVILRMMTHPTRSFDKKGIPNAG